MRQAIEVITCDACQKQETVESSSSIQPLSTYRSAVKLDFPDADQLLGWEADMDLCKSCRATLREDLRSLVRRYGAT